MRSLRQLVTLAGIANAFHSGTVHILGQSDDVGVLPSPVTALPELAIGTARDDLLIPRRTAAVRIIVIVGERRDAVVSFRLFHQLHHSVVAADALVDLLHCGIAGVLAAILPAPEMDDLRRIVSQLCDLVDELFALLKGR